MDSLKIMNSLTQRTIKDHLTQSLPFINEETEAQKDDQPGMAQGVHGKAELITQAPGWWHTAHAGIPS